MNHDQARELFREEALSWAALTAVLEAFPDALLTIDDEPWRSAQVYAHLARWFARTASDLQALAAGEHAPPASDADALNATWRREDRNLLLEAARNRAMAERWRLLTIPAETPRARWSDAFVATFRAGTLQHYRQHLDSFVLEPAKAAV
jgi:hypothetical protein